MKLVNFNFRWKLTSTPEAKSLSILNKTSPFPTSLGPNQGPNPCWGPNPDPVPDPGPDPGLGLNPGPGPDLGSNQDPGRCAYDSSGFNSDG